MRGQKHVIWKEMIERTRLILRKCKTLTAETKMKTLTTLKWSAKKALPHQNLWSKSSQFNNPLSRISLVTCLIWISKSHLAEKMKLQRQIKQNKILTTICWQMFLPNSELTCKKLETNKKLKIQSQTTIRNLTTTWAFLYQTLIQQSLKSNES